MQMWKFKYKSETNVFSCGGDDMWLINHFWSFILQMYNSSPLYATTPYTLDAADVHGDVRMVSFRHFNQEMYAVSHKSTTSTHTHTLQQMTVGPFNMCLLWALLNTLHIHSLHINKHGCSERKKSRRTRNARAGRHTSVLPTLITNMATNDPNWGQSSEIMVRSFKTNWYLL